MLLAKFRENEVQPTLSMEQAAMAIYASKATGTDTFSGTAAPEPAATGQQQTGGAKPQSSWCSPALVTTPNTEARATGIGPSPWVSWV
jgi:hypothetical protein